MVNYVRWAEDSALGANPNGSGSWTIDKFGLNYLSVVYPFERLGRNMILSLNYQNLYDFRYWRFERDSPTGKHKYEYETNSALYALGLVYGVQITPAFSVGLTVNYWGNLFSNNGWEQNYSTQANVTVGAAPFVMDVKKKEKYSFDGWNVNLGFLWRITEHWTLGGVLKTPFTADINQTFVFHETKDYATLTGSNVNRVICNDEYDQELDMPMSYGVGIAYRYSDNFTISTDVYRTHWDDFEYRDEDGNEISPVSQKRMKSSDIDPVTGVRMGVEYLYIMENICIPFRAGVFYDPAPAENSPDDYYGFSLGSGLAYKRYVFDIAYQYKFGNNVEDPALKYLDYSRDVREHTVYTSLIVHF